MTKALRAHLRNSYGKAIAVWGGTLLTAASHFISKILVPLSIASWLVSILPSSDPAIASLALIAFLFLLAIGLGWLGDYVFVRSTDERYKELVSKFHDALMERDVSFFRNERAGALGTLFRDYLDGTIGIFRLLRTEIIPLFVTTVLPVFVLLPLDWKVAAIFGVAVTLRIVLSYKGLMKVKLLRKDALVAYRDLSGVMSDQMAHLAVVRASANYDDNRARVTNLASDEAKLFWVRHRMATLFEFCMNLLTALCSILILVVIGYMSRGSPNFLETAIVSLIYIIQAMQASHGAGEIYQRWNEHMARVTLALGKLDASSSTQIWVNAAASTSPSNGEIEFRQVKFGYRANLQNSEIFDSLNVSVPDGMHFAVIGENGAGKSTLVNLLMRFDDVNDGQVILGGKDVKLLSKEHLYRSLSYVPQEPRLFNETVEDNLLFFEPDASRERLDIVSRIVGMDKVLETLPDGPMTLVGEMGSNLSGGQKQRVAIARALLRDASIYVFDEATSAIQADAAREIIENVREFLTGRTLMVITHSPAIPHMFEHVLRVADGDARWIDR